MPCTNTFRVPSNRTALCIGPQRYSMPCSSSLVLSRRTRQRRPRREIRTRTSQPTRTVCRSGTRSYVDSFSIPSCVSELGPTQRPVITSQTVVGCVCQNLHTAGNIDLRKPGARVLFTGDVPAKMEPPLPAICGLLVPGSNAVPPLRSPLWTNDTRGHLPMFSIVPIHIAVLNRDVDPVTVLVRIFDLASEAQVVGAVLASGVIRQRLAPVPATHRGIEQLLAVSVGAITRRVVWASCYLAVLGRRGRDWKRQQQGGRQPD